MASGSSIGMIICVILIILIIVGVVVWLVFYREPTESDEEDSTGTVKTINIDKGFDVVKSGNEWGLSFRLGSKNVVQVAYQVGSLIYLYANHEDFIYAYNLTDSTLTIRIFNPDLVLNDKTNGPFTVYYL